MVGAAVGWVLWGAAFLAAPAVPVPDTGVPGIARAEASHDGQMQGLEWTWRPGALAE